MFSCDIARPVSRAALAKTNAVAAVVAEPVAASVRVMAVERAEHKLEPVRVLVWL